MRSGDVALRFSIVFAVAGFITIAAGIYEIDRREKSSSETVTANLTEIDQRVRILSDQIRILNDQYTRQINANARELQALGIQIQTLESRLNELDPTACTRWTQAGSLFLRREVRCHARRANRRTRSASAGSLGPLRPIELQRLTPEQIKDDHWVLRPSQTKKERPRTCYIEPDLARKMRALIASGTLPKSQRLAETFAKAAKSAGTDLRVNLHSLRHTLNTRMAQAGVLKEIREFLLGHNRRDGNDIYTHLRARKHFSDRRAA